MELEKPVDRSDLQGEHQQSDVLGAVTIDSSSVNSIVISFEGKEEQTLVAKQRQEFRSYELYESSNYIRNLSRRILKG